jgi:hypothetical protein
MATGNPAWYDVLLAARKVATDGLLTSVDLGPKTGMDPKTASAWLSKFVRWGYCTLAGSKAGNQRWLRVYRITDWGMSYKPGKKFGKVKKADGTLK